MVSNRNSTVFLSLVPLYVKHLFPIFLWLHLIFSLFNNLTIICLSVVFFLFVLLGICWYSWYWGFIVCVIRKFFSHYSNNFSIPPSISSLSVTPVSTLDRLILFRRSLSFFSFFCRFFSACASVWLVFIVMSSSLLIFFSAVSNPMLI